jgi:hypothetical protein
MGYFVRMRMARGQAELSLASVAGGPGVVDRATFCPLPRTDFVPLVAVLLGAAGSCLAQGVAEKADPRLPEVVIEAKRQAADEQVTRQVQQGLTNDPWIFADHITITTQNGVVRLEGIVGDTGEMFRILRLCRRIPGARRVVNALEIMHNDPDGG